MKTGRQALRRAPDVRYRVLDGEAVVIRQRAAEVLGLNVVGTAILELADGTRTGGQIAAEVAARFAVDLTQAEADVEQFLEQLQRAGVVAAADSAGG